MNRSSNCLRRRLRVEYLEPRVVLSLSFGFDPLEVAGHHRPGHAGGPGGSDPPEEPPGIDLPTVVAHEIGHALGLRHSNSSDCGSAGQPLMCAFYLGQAFSLQQEDIDRINGLYPEPGVSPDTTNTQGSWDHTNLTYSFMPDGTELEQQRVVGGGPPRLETDLNTLFATLNAKFSSAAEWQGIFSDALDLWTAASEADGMGTVLTFTEVDDDGHPFDEGVDVSEQGEIRFGAHTFDGAEGALAHGYFAPPNGNTAAGDIHLDEAENWQDLESSPLSTTSSAKLRPSPSAHAHPHGAAGFVFGHVGGESGDLIGVPVSLLGQAQHSNDQEAQERNESADDQEVGDSPRSASIWVTQAYKVDSVLAAIGRKDSTGSRATHLDLDLNGEELEETFLIDDLLGQLGGQPQ